MTVTFQISRQKQAVVNQFFSKPRPLAPQIQGRDTLRGSDVFVRFIAIFNTAISFTVFFARPGIRDKRFAAIALIDIFIHLYINDAQIFVWTGRRMHII